MPDFLLNFLGSPLGEFLGNPSDNPTLLVVAVIISTFMLEDLAIIAAAMLAVSGRMSPEIAFTAVCTGMLIGDTALYLFGRLANTWERLGQWLNHPLIRRQTVPLQQSPWQQLALIRCMPGIRTFGYIACGIARVPALPFTLANVVSILIWAAGLFGGAYLLGQHFAEQMHEWLWWLMPVALVLFVLGQRRIRQNMEESDDFSAESGNFSRS